MYPRSKKTTVIAYLIYLALAIAVVENIFFLILRLQHQLIFSRSVPDYDAVYRFDRRREGGHLLPNQNGWMKGERLDHPVRIITNSKGFRNDREFEYAVPAHTFRILFLGDSYVDGMRTDQTRTIGYLLEQALNKNEKVDGINAYEVMISSHSDPADAWYYYQEFGFRYHPQLILLGVTIGNDLTRHGYRSSLWPETDANGNRVLTLKKSDGQHTEKESWFPEEAYVPEQKISLLNRTQCRVREWVHNIFPLWAGYLVPASYWYTDPPFDTRRHVQMQSMTTSLGLAYRPVPAEIEKQYVNFEEVLDGFASAAKHRGSGLAIVLFPTRLQSSEKEWQLFVKFYSINPSKFDLKYPDRRIGEFCRKRGIPCLDLLPAFEEHYRQSNKPLYRPHGDMHFNEDGQALAAREIHPFIKKFLPDKKIAA